MIVHYILKLICNPQFYNVVNEFFFDLNNFNSYSMLEKYFGENYDN